MEKGVKPACTQVLSRFQQGFVKLLQSAKHHHGHITHAEGNMSNNDRGHAQFNRNPGQRAECLNVQHKKQQKAHPHENIRHHQRRINKGIIHPFVDLVFHPVKRQCRQRTEDGRDHGRDQSDEQCIPQGFPYPVAVKQLFIPDHGESLPFTAILAFVEGGNTHHDQRRIEKDQSQQRYKQWKRTSAVTTAHRIAPFPSFFCLILLSWTFLIQ